MESPSASAADARASETSAGVSESPLHVTSLHVTGSAALRMGWRCPSGSGTVVSALWTDRPVPGEAQRPLVLGLSAEAPAAWSPFTFDCWSQNLTFLRPVLPAFLSLPTEDSYLTHRSCYYVHFTNEETEAQRTALTGHFKERGKGSSVRARWGPGWQDKRSVSMLRGPQPPSTLGPVIHTQGHGGGRPR